MVIQKVKGRIKKVISVGALAALACLLLSQTEIPENTMLGQEDRVAIKITKSFGSFSIPEDWTEITRYSRNEKFFYSHKSEKIGSTMTNISIEVGRNPYALDDHMTFRYAILRQMLMQAGGSEVHGSGTFTNHDDPLYIFTILDKEVTTIQFYINTKKKHILVHVTDFHNGNITDAEEVAQFIADSFVWAE
jgi:predicted ATP-dependent Lon-type protease